MAYLDENGLEHFWGKIKDHVSSAIAPKANDADVLHKTGTETVSGEKVFSGSQTTPSGNASALLVVKDPNLVKGETPETNHYLSLGFIDSTGNSYAQDAASRLGVVEYKSPSEADPEGFMQLYDVGFNGGGGGAILRVGHDKDNVRFASAPATSDDRTNSTDIVTRGYMEASEWNWQKTKKAGAVTFKPVPESDLEPVVDFMFTETLPAEGEKGPENPSTITGVSSVDVTRCGKNILKTKDAGTTTSNNVSITSNGDGSYTFNSPNGASTGQVFYQLPRFGEKWFQQGISFTFSCETESQDTSWQMWVANSAYGGGYLGRSPSVITPTKTLVSGVAIYIPQNVTLDNVTLRPQLELGSVKTSFEQGVGNAYTIQLGDTYYGGSLNVATGVMTVTWGAKIIDGTESFSRDATYSTDTVNVFTSQLGLPQSIMSNSPLATDRFCSHFSWSNSIVVDTYSTWGTATNALFKLSASEYPDVASFKNWLASEYSAGHPVILGFLLNNPYTVQLTPTQIRSLPALDKYEPRINTVYTDQEAVQVGYRRFANYVDLTTDQTINGNKTFTYPVVYAGNHSTAFQAKIPEIERGNVTTSIYKMPFFVNDKNDRRTCGLYEEVLSSGEHNISLLVFDATSINNTYTYLKVGFDENQVPYAFAPFTPFSRVNGHDIVTRSYLSTASIYVDSVNGNDSNEGTSASNAFKTISTALGKVSHRPRCTIHIAAGTYTENITITEGSYFIFKLYGNVVINGNFVVTRNSGLHISPNNSAYTFTAKSLIVSYASFLYSDAKFITTYSGVSCYDESEIAFNYGVDITINTGNSQYGLYANVESYIYVNKELSIQAGSASGSNVNNALFAYKSSFILINNTTTNITCAGPVIASDMQSVIFLHNDSYSDSNNTFTATTSTRNAIYAMDGYIRTDNIKINITHTRDENISGNVIVNLNDNSTFRLNTSQLNLTCTGKAYNFIGVFYNSVFIFGSSNSLTFNGASYAGTINCQYNSCVFISSAATVSGTVTSGYRFYVARGGQINIQGHSAGLNRIPGASAGVVESSSYGYYG